MDRGLLKTGQYWGGTWLGAGVIVSTASVLGRLHRQRRGSGYKRICQYVIAVGVRAFQNIGRVEKGMNVGILGCGIYCGLPSSTS
jgi:hypothetical protein